jgi:thiaminase
MLEKPTGLSELQVEWIEQWIDPFHEKIRAATEEAINEYGEQSTDYERDKMRWLFLRGTQYQIGTFDAAWNLSDPWPGEGEETGVIAGSPNS